MMSKTEIFLLILLAVILLGCVWFIFSDEIWLLLCSPWVKGVSFEAVGRPSFYGAWLDKH